MMQTIVLREVRKEDLSIFFQQQCDPDAIKMAAFTRKDPTDEAAFTAHWTRILNDSAVCKRTILFEGQVVGHISKFEQFGEPEISYWIGKEYWGKGIATSALSAFLHTVTERPLYGRAAKDNLASQRVLEKCGFTLQGCNRDFANARGEEIEEVIFTLTATPGNGTG